MAHVEVDQNAEKVISTSGLNLGRQPTSSIELVPEGSKPLIEIAEPVPTAKYDTESDSECEWLANPGKIAPRKFQSEKREEDEPPRAPSPVPEPEPEITPEDPHPDVREHVHRTAADILNDPVQAATSFLQSSSIFNETEDGIRRKKSFLLHQYSLKNKDHRYSSKVLTMDCDLREIQDELQFVETRKSMEGNLSLWKTGLVVISDGLVRLNERFDPFGVDMNEWSQRMWYDVMQKGSYDEVLSELVEKYKGTVPVGPELRLLCMLGMSFGSTLLTKKQEQAQLEKLRREQERHINAEVEARVRERLNRQQPAPAARMSQPRKTSPPRRSPLRSPIRTPVRSPSPTELHGPTFTVDEVRNLMKDDLLSSSDEEEEVTAGPRTPSPRTSRATSTVSNRSRSPSPVRQVPAFVTPQKKAPARRGGAAPRGSRRGRGRSDLIVNLDKD
jgi:uncharacterized protein DUF5767